MASEKGEVGSGQASGWNAAHEKRSQPVLFFVANVAWFFVMHRLHLATAARDAGFEVHVAAAPNSADDVRRMEDAGLHFHPLALKRGRWSVVEEARLTNSLRRLYRTVRPSIVHHVTIKPVLCGTLAAQLAGVPAIVNAMTGLGFVFTTDDRWAAFRRIAVTSAYRLLFARSRVRVIFENGDDLATFTGQGIVSAEQAVLIRGAGVDLERFRPAQIPSDVPVVVLPARMLWDKGVGEFCEAAAKLRGSGIEARFVLVGGLDPENPATIPESWLLERVRSGAVEWWGHRQDIPAVYAQASIVCLPSYREGLPTVLLEGAACGCALITTDVPGCREVVADRKTGLLVRARDAAALASALRELIEDGGLRRELARAAQQRVRTEFSTHEVQRRTLSLYRSLLESGDRSVDR